MTIQNLSIVVPTGECWNKCAFCVSRMHHEDYGKSIIDYNMESLPESYLNRMKWTKEQGCDTIMITGTAEPQQNMKFIKILLKENAKFPNPFYKIELQTTGSGMVEEDFIELAKLGLTTVSFSVSAPDDENNWRITNMPPMKHVNIKELCNWVTKAGMILRLSVNLNSTWNNTDIFKWAKDLGAHQLTLRKLYTSGENEQSKWISDNIYEENKYQGLVNFINKKGILIQKLPYGFKKMSLDDMSIVVDDDCMSKNNDSDLKYVILRPNGHLYSRWDDKGSIVF